MAIDSTFLSNLYFWRVSPCGVRTTMCFASSSLSFFSFYNSCSRHQNRQRRVISTMERIMPLELVLTAIRDTDIPDQWRHG